MEFARYVRKSERFLRDTEIDALWDIMIIGPYVRGGSSRV
jgi:hypothetical protein